jgi:hypothetical protein
MMNEHSEIARASDLGLKIRSSNDLADILAAALENDGLLLTESDLAPEFFDLRSGLAGEAFQKFANYGARVAIVVRARDRYGARFSELIYEHSTHPLVRFFGTEAEAAEWLRAAS